MVPRFYVSKLGFDKKYRKKDFQNELEKYIGSNVVLMPSARAALEIFLKLRGVKKHHKVLLSALNAPSIVKLIKKLAKPVFVEVDERTLNIDPEDFDKKQGDFILVLHSEGNPCNMNKIMKIAEEKKIEVIEDCAHSIGSSFKGKKTGSFGNAAILSFGKGKPINALSGGALVLKDEKYVERAISYASAFKKKSIFKFYSEFVFNNILHIFSNGTIFSFIKPLLKKIDILTKLFKDRGKSKKYLMHRKQFNFGVKSLSLLEKKSKERKLKAEKIKKEFPKKIFQKEVGKMNYHNLVFFSKDNESFRKFMLSYGIDIQKTWLKGFTEKSKILENKIAYLPIHENVKKEDIDRMIEAIKDYQNSIS